MAAFRDLEPCSYFGAQWATRLTAIGWIESRDQYTRGPLLDGFFEALAALSVDPWQPFVFAGRHRCTLCRFSGGPAVIHLRERAIDCGVRNLFVVDDDRAYVAPSMIAHYIDSHEYGPPVEFQRAVLSSPPMKSIEYYKLLVKAGIAQLDKAHTSPDVLVGGSPLRDEKGEPQ